MKRVVYSALIGGYERLLEQPAAHSSDIEFILFTDGTEVDESKGWRVVPVNPRFPKDPIRSARFLKIVGHELLDAYDETLWIDNRVVLKEGFESIFDENDQFDMTLPVHSFRGCVRDEFITVLSMGFDDPGRVREMYTLVRAAGLESAQTLWTGIIIRKRNAAVNECMRLWMDYILLTSRRDQLSVNLAISACHPAVNYLSIDNWESNYHNWASVDLVRRNTRIQKWRNPRSSLAIRISDRIRSLPHGYKLARALAKSGVELPTLPN